MQRRNSRRLLWLEQREPGREGKKLRAGKGWGVVEGSHGEDLDLYPKRVGSPGGLWAGQRRGLTWVLTGALLWLLQCTDREEGRSRGSGVQETCPGSRK